MGLSATNDSSSKGQSRLSAVFTIIKCNWGIGMMAMPYMLDAAGTVSGIIMFIASNLLTQFAIVNLIDVKNELSRTPPNIYAGGPNEARPLIQSINEDGRLDKPNPNRRDLDFSTIMSKSLGPFGDWGALFSIVLSTYGSNIAYVLFIYDNMNKFFSDALPRSDDWIWLQLIPFVALAWADSVDFMAPFSLFGLLCAFSFASLAVYNTASSLEPSEFYDILKAEPFIKFETFPLAMSIAAFCNEGIVVLSPSTHSSMAKPELYNWTAFWGICFFIVCYMGVGIAGNILYHGDVKSEMSLNFATSGKKLGIYQASVVLYSLQLIPTYAVVFFVSYEAVECKFLRYFGINDRIGVINFTSSSCVNLYCLVHNGWMGPQHLKSLRKKLPYFLHRVLWIVISGVIALQIPKFGDYLGLIGALANSLAIYIMPQVSYLLMIPAKQGFMNKVRRTGCLLLAVFGIALAIGGTYQSVRGMITPAKHTYSPTAAP